MFSLCKSNDFVGKLGSFTGTLMTSNDQLDHCNYFIFIDRLSPLWAISFFDRFASPTGVMLYNTNDVIYSKIIYNLLA